MHLEIKKINSEDVEKSEKYFWINFCKNLKKEKPWTYNESLVARYLLEKKYQRAKALCWQAINYSSISHKKNLVFIWTKNSKIWLDIELLKIRDKNLLNKFREEEYHILWWKKTQRTKEHCWKNMQRAKALCWQAVTFKNFYVLWTAKESIIKYESLLLDNIEEIVLESSENINLEINKIKFSKKLLLYFWNKKFEVYSWSELDLYYSVCVKSN